MKTNCANCGAPWHGSPCSYCGTWPSGGFASIDVTRLEDAAPRMILHCGEMVIPRAMAESIRRDHRAPPRRNPTAPEPYRPSQPSPTGYPAESFWSEVFFALSATFVAVILGLFLLALVVAR